MDWSKGSWDVLTSSGARSLQSDAVNQPSER